MYNIRGNDVAYCPVVHAFAIVTSNSAFLYVDKRKVSAEVSLSNVSSALNMFQPVSCMSVEVPKLILELYNMELLHVYIVPGP